MFLRGLTPQPGVNCIHTAITLGKYLISKISKLYIQNLHEITNVEFYFKRLFNVLEYYDDSDYSDEENIIQDGDKDEEKLNQLLRNIQPEMPKGSIEFSLFTNVSRVKK